MKPVKLLAIESSCDETAASVLVDGEIKSNLVASQEVHARYGGVVPELASRAHQKNIVPVVQAALQEAHLTPQDLQAVAFTQGPGLLGALLVGTSFAKGLALSLNIPLIGVHHMQAHILAHFIDDPKPQFPFICLTVSGGHTQLVLVHDYLEMEILGETQDDAVGEAFDKTAKLLGLGYPGGPKIDQYAQQGNPHAFTFPEVSTPGLNYSFSGIKTAFLHFLQKEVRKNPNFVEERLPDICASMQQTLLRILLQKLKKAVKLHGVKHIGIAGGVSANQGLRQQLLVLGQEKGWHIYLPDFQYCTDNAGMIAMAGYYQYQAGEFTPQASSPQPRMKFSPQQPESF